MAPISPNLKAKRDRLRANLAASEKLLVAFSGGVDSSYLACEAHRCLGEHALAVTALSPSYPEHHRASAESVVAKTGMAHRFVATHEAHAHVNYKNKIVEASEDSTVVTRSY